MTRADFLAKTLRGSSETRTIEQHCLDVSEAVRVLLMSPALGARAAAALGRQVTKGVVHSLCAIAFIHDAGKTDARWQCYISGTGTRRDHTAPFLAHLDTTPKLVAALQPVLSLVDDPVAMLLTTIAHHGSPIPVETQRLYATERTDDAAVEEIARLTAVALARYSEAVPIVWTPEFSHVFAGILMLADWLGSSIAFERGVDRGAVVRKLLDTTGWRAFSAGVDPLSLLGEYTPSEAQRAVLDAPLDDRLLLLEDLTGAGKTEAAMLRALALIDAGRVEGMYFAVPTRSAATELHRRIAAGMSAMHPGQGGRVMRLIPTALDTDPLMIGQERSWAVGAAKKAQIAPFGVGTIDQAMLTVLTTRHAWLRRAALSTKLLVVDEIHAGDAYMISVIETLVDDHLKAGGHVLGMSATLGEEAKARLLRRELKPVAEARVRPYPMLTSERGETALRPRSERSVSISKTSHVDARRAAVDAAQAGARVLWIRSTVREIVADYAALKASGTQVVLHHSRYAQHDREIKDGVVLGALGKGGNRSGPGLIVAATQTCEQSLDIDADLMVTDAVPADVMLQRWGRLHRHERTRPDGFELARCVIIDPGDWEPYLRAPDPARRAYPPQGWRYVYAALPVIACVEALTELGDVIVPRDQRSLVEASTHREALKALTSRGEAWQAAWRDYVGAMTAGRRVAGTALIDRSEQYGYGTTDSVAATRLGDPSYAVKTPGLLSPLDGAEIPEIAVPARFLHEEKVAAERAAVERSSENAWLLSIGEARMRYSDLGLHPERRP